MKVVTYIAQFLKSKGIDTVFELQGGMITHLIDEMYKNEFTIVSVHHEQAAAMAADAYARVKNQPGVALATSGPGATNLITGIGNCYFDSVPAIFITGQVNTNEQKGNRPIRQLGFQETDIVSIIKPITKAAYAVKDAKDIPAIFKEAYSISMQGRQGPVLIDIPMNIQHQECEEFKEDKEIVLKPKTNSQTEDFITELTKALHQSKKPLLLAGRGVRAANATSELLELVEKHNLPVVTSLNGIDVIPYNHPNRIGFIGSYGNRWANYAMGSCDLLLVLGSRLDLRQTGVDIDSFILGKTIYHIDVEEGELNNRFTTSKVLCSDVFTFLQALLKVEKWEVNYNNWYKEIEEKRLERGDIDELSDIKGLNPNKFIHVLSEYSKKAKAISTDVGSNQMWVAQSIELGREQFFLTSGGMGAMGYALPAAIGACFALNREPILCIVGDGGFQINIQELQTIKRNNLPIKIVIMNNHCLGMIRQFQDSYFESNYAATVWGYSEPDFVSIANAYGINASKIETEEQIAEGLRKLWEDPSQAYLLDVSFDIHTNVYPKMLFGSPITKMEPLY
jgi:acetolactate synthase-1/2/3 large subunit